MILIVRRYLQGFPLPAVFDNVIKNSIEHTDFSLLENKTVFKMKSPYKQKIVYRMYLFAK